MRNEHKKIYPGRSNRFIRNANHAMASVCQRSAAVLDRNGGWLAGIKTVLLSLLNATLLLAIVLTILGLALIHKVERFTGKVISKVHFSLLEEAEKDVKTVAKSIVAAERDLRRISDRITKLVNQPVIVGTPGIEQQLRGLVSQVNTLQKDIVGLEVSHMRLSDRSIQQIASAIANTIIKLRHCSHEKISRSAMLTMAQRPHTLSPFNEVAK